LYLSLRIFDTALRELKIEKRIKPGEEIKDMPPKGRGQQNNNSSGSSLKLNVDVRLSQTANLTEFLKCLPNIKHADDSISLFKEIVPVKMRGQSVNIDTGRKLLKWEALNSHGTVGHLTFLEQDGNIKTVKAYQKTIPLIDAYSWLRYKERPTKPFFWQYEKHDIVSAENQAYVDCLASYMVGKMGKQIKSPHFCDFYGAFRGVSDIFYYNMEDDIDEFRFTNWFWDGLEKGEFGLRVINKATNQRLSLDEIKLILKPDDKYLHDDSDDDFDNDDNSEEESDSGISDALSIESLPPIESNNVITADIIFDDADSINTETESIHINKNDKPKELDELSFNDEYEIHAELFEIPVAIQYIEYCEGTIDELLESIEFAPIINNEQEKKWIAWLFQICVACSQLQNHLKLTHNDLHTSNVLWKKTDIQHLFYKDSNGRTWCVPTFGYIFSIIDYGRAIFTLNNFVIVSSDYNDGHDACGMYNFGPILDDSMPKILPNKSFDLCRLTCSLLRGLFHHNPPSLEKGTVLTKEGTWEVRETPNPLFNILWSWLKTKGGVNILETEKGEEKFPGFDLYAVIAKEVAGAVPEEQFKKDIFKHFQFKTDKNIMFIPMN
jgi:hypothetical protein